MRGSACTSLQVADLLPGIFDGVHVSCTYPDALSIALAGLDARLLANYFLNGNPGGFTEAQMVTVSGHANARAWYDLALQAARTDPIPGRQEPIPASPIGGPYRAAVFHPDVPEALRYHPKDNPAGARPTVFDWARNVYGVAPTTGFARRPFDNVGVQYGLAALNAGVIDADQFLDLNERIGGYDQDANYTVARSVGDVVAIERAHRSGASLSGGGGLAAIPVFDWSNIYDEENFYHYQWFHFAVRERMREQNGHTEKPRHVARGPADHAAHRAAQRDRGNAELECLHRLGRRLYGRPFRDAAAGARSEASASGRRRRVL